MENINKVELLEEIIYNAPLVLLTLDNKEMINLANDYLPYSTGFEIECHYGKDYNVENFKKIPNILHVNNTSGEQRYRIPSGIKGMLCLYNISQQLKLNSELNPGSGVHIHVDMTDYTKEISNKYILDNKEWVLNELDSWGYKGGYNSRRVGQGKGGWLGFRNSTGWDTGTAEFRCGEMTFEYKELLKNIISANSIIRRVKAAHGLAYITPEIQDIDAEPILAYSSITNLQEANVIHLHNKLKELQLEIEELQPSKYEEMMRVIKNRVTRI